MYSISDTSPYVRIQYQTTARTYSVSDGPLHAHTQYQTTICIHVLSIRTPFRTDVLSIRRPPVCTYSVSDNCLYSIRQLPIYKNSVSNNYHTYVLSIN